MNLTKEILEQGKSSNGGWSAKQLRLFGIEYPLDSGWQSAIIDSDFPVEKIEKFLELRNKHLKKKLSKKSSDFLLIRRLREEHNNLTLDQLLDKLKDDNFYEKALSKKVK